ncbi:MAG TPA: type II secretion system protein [Holophagaceae bacterium]|nr:type II secretion system protein [Holophagaceae bacterium]
MPRGAPPTAPRRTPTAQRGYTMALLLALIVVMGIMLTMARPTLRAEVQRENEAELIFRGEAIARALKAYSAKFGKYPQDLDEVMKVRPLLLRQKYKDPMTPTGEWDVITQVQPGVTGETRGLPIIGVKSRCDLDAFRLYKNKSLISDWRFLADENVLGAGGDGGRGGVVPAGGSTGGGKGGSGSGGGGGDKTPKSGN